MNCIRRAKSDSQTHQHLHALNSINMARFRLCHVNTEGKIFLVELFLGVYYLISRMTVTDLGCRSENFLETSVHVRGAMIH